MKIWIFLLSFLIPTFGFSSSTTSAEIWVSNKYELKVKLKFYKNKIKAKHLTRRGWTTFRRVGPGEYSDFRGSKLIIEDRDLIVFTSRYRRKNVVFHPVGKYLRQGNSSSFHRTKYLGGSWRIKGLQKKLYISETATGIEARIEGQQGWTKYFEKDSGYFVDGKGNSYTVKNENELFWESRDGRTQYSIYR